MIAKQLLHFHKNAPFYSISHAMKISDLQPLGKERGPFISLPTPKHHFLICN
jgi:hypothetical protein